MAGGLEGRIVRSLSGFYDVQCGTRRVQCRARGRLRTQEHSPLVGDRVYFTPGEGREEGKEEGEGVSD